MTLRSVRKNLLLASLCRVSLWGLRQTCPNRDTSCAASFMCTVWFSESETVTVVHTSKYLWNYAISTARVQSLRHTVRDCVPMGYVMQQSVFSPRCDMSYSGLRWEEFSVYSSEQLWLTHQTWQFKWKLWLQFSGWQHCIYHRICTFFYAQLKLVWWLLASFRYIFSFCAWSV